MSEQWLGVGLKQLFLRGEGQNSHVLSIITAPSFHPEAAVWHAFVQNLEREKFWFIYLFLLINTFSAWLPSTVRWCCEHRQDSSLDKCVAGWQVALGDTSLYMCHTWAPYTVCTLNNQLHNWLQLYNWLHNWLYNWLYNWLQLYNWLYNCNQLCNQFYNCLQLYNWL